jgi:hypothetical protein
MYFILMCTKLARIFKLDNVKLGMPWFTKKSAGMQYYKKQEILYRHQTAVSSTVCPYAVASVLLNVTKVG